MSVQQEKVKNYIVYLLFATLLALGIACCKDYGVSWDEPIERENGIYSFCAAYRFLTGDAPVADLSKWSDRYYGNGLQHILLFADYICNCLTLNLYGNPLSWFLRHMLTFLFTVTGLFFMYRTALLLWRDKLKALVPVLLFLFMPRFAAESFYNIKDMGLLAGMMTGGYFLVRYGLHRTWQNALFLGIAAAFVCSIRLAGIQLAAAGAGIALFMDLLCKRKFSLSKTAGEIFSLLGAFILFLILFYPACWGTDFTVFFKEAFSYMAKHPWPGNIRFCGADYSAGTTPWYYLAVWIGITTPLPILLLLFAGSTCVLRKYFSKPAKFFRKPLTLMLLLFFLMFWGELLLQPFTVKHLYNGWRHFYFLGYPMLILASVGAYALYNFAMKRRITKVLLAAAVIAAAGVHITWMISEHPHQYLYFNILPRNPQKDFELDYWHVSNANGIRRLLERDAGTPGEKTLSFDYTLLSALATLDEEELKKFRVVSRFGFHDYAVIMNDNDFFPEKYQKRISPRTPPRIIFSETRWVWNSLRTKKVAAYTILEFERTPDLKSKNVSF